MLMSRCRHGEITVTEFGDWATYHTKTADGWIHEHEPGSYSRKILVECASCAYSRYHWRGEKRMPAWIKKALEELGV